MPSKIILLLSFISLSAIAEPAHYMAVIGGGSEPADKETTIFDPDISSIARFGNGAGYESNVIFNGGHSKTEDIIKKNFSDKGSPTDSFTPSSFETMISGYETKIKNGTIKSGDQLLVYIHTHGAKRKSDSEESHSIGFGQYEGTVDLTSLRAIGRIASSNPYPTGVISLDRLKKLTELAEEKGVKLGILDFSCHSGGSQVLGNSKTCVISSAGYNNFGFSTWGPNFSSKMRKGKTLEEIYLNNRAHDTTPAFPMISTPIGKELQDELYPLVDTFMHHYRAPDTNDKVAGMLYEQVETNSCTQAEIKFADLQKLLVTMEQRFKTLEISGQDFDRLRQLLTQYNDLQTRLRNRLKELKPVAFTTKKEFCGTWDTVNFGGTKAPNCFAYSPKELMMADFTSTIARDKAMQASITTPPYQVELWRSRMEQWQMIQAKQAELKADPSYNDYATYLTTIPNLTTTTYKLAGDISKEMKKIYAAEYDKRSRTDTRPNPCRDFKL